MDMFKRTTYLSEILEESEMGSTVIFKYSSLCGTSDILKDKIEKIIKDQNIKNSIYIVVVQEMPILSKNIETILSIKHESPQIIILNKGKVTYCASHQNIDINNIAKS